MILKNYYQSNTHIEISKSAVDHNALYYKNHIGPNNKLAIIIKGNGYGHGLAEMALICEQSKLIDWLCVATLSEALTIIPIVATKPILVLGYPDADPTDAVNKNIIFMIDSIEYAKQLNNIGKKHSYQFTVHVKIDTGLSRLGIMPEQAYDLISNLKKLPFIAIDGLFSHFIASDNNKELTDKQLNLFTTTKDQLSTFNIKHIHMSNTHALKKIAYPSFFNFFRVGIGIYGYDNNTTHVQPVLTWKTTIASIKEVRANSYVSYACTYKTDRSTRIALLPVGYSHGYPLRLSNKGEVMINSTRAPVIGRVGMNMMMVDISNCPASKGDTVILTGPLEPIHATDLSRKAGIDNVRELLTNISPSIRRIITP